jgi:hypothetical protein
VAPGATYLALMLAYLPLLPQSPCVQKGPKQFQLLRSWQGQGIFWVKMPWAQHWHHSTAARKDDRPGVTVRPGTA